MTITYRPAGATEKEERTLPRAGAGKVLPPVISTVQLHLGAVGRVLLVHQLPGGEVGVEGGDGAGLEDKEAAFDDAPLDVAGVAVVGGDLISRNKVISFDKIPKTF